MSGFNTGTEPIIRQTCLTDFYIDGELDFFDVSAFLDAFQTQDPMADLNGDGNFNFFDVSMFIVEYQSGCQSGKPS